MKKFTILLIVFIAILWQETGYCQLEDTEMALFEDVPIVVTSASGREQRMQEVSNAMYVITKEDIERSGAINIPELFRSVPGMQIRKIDKHRYFVGIRGDAQLATFNILVLIDGVVVFNPAFNGTFWEALPITIDEVEQIEIIRGPGGMLYSSNAVNGVINIMTKKVTDEEKYIALAAGTQDYKAVSLGGGFKKEKLSIRGYGDYSFDHGYNRKHVANGTNASVPNRVERENIGLKAQYDFSEDVRVKMDAKYQQNNGTNDGTQTFSRQKNVNSFLAFLTRFEQKVNENYDYYVNLDYVGHMWSYLSSRDSDVNAFSAMTQHNFIYDFYGRNVTSLGSEIRFNHVNSPSTIFPEPQADPEQTQRIVSYFLQNEYHPIDKLCLTGGVRISTNQMVPDHVDKYMVEPRLSIMYELNPRHNFRAVATKSYRTPSIFEHQANAYIVAIGGPVDLWLVGNNAVEPEVAWTYELGRRGKMLNRKLHMNADFFVVNLFDVVSNWADLVSAAPDWLLRTENNGNMTTVGFEVDGEYKISDNFKVHGDYTYTEPTFDMDHHPSDPTVNAIEYHVSKHQAGLGLRYSRDKFDFDFYGKWISKYCHPGTPVKKYPGYVKTLLRFAYDVTLPGLNPDEYEAEVELVATDFAGARVTEATHDYFREPNVYAGLKIKF